jgi:hypothetical protein
MVEGLHRQHMLLAFMVAPPVFMIGLEQVNDRFTQNAYK